MSASDVQKLQAIDFRVALGFHVHEFQQRQNCADVAELIVGKGALKPGEGESGPLVKEQGQIVCVDDVERSFGSIRIGVEWYSRDVQRLEARMSNEVRT